METEKYKKYEKAVKHVKGIREFYKHLVTYLVFVIALLVLKTRIVYVIQVNTENPDPRFLDWIHANIYWIPILWGIGVLIHGLCVYRLKSTFFKDWEDRKMKELMQEEEQQGSTRWE